MKFIVDGNVFSEPTKPLFEQRVVDWLNANGPEIATDAVVMGEIWSGVDALPAGRKKQALVEWFEDLQANVLCLPWTLETAIVWGELLNSVKRAGFTVGLADTMIAATAKRHGLTVVTRNVEDFTRCGVAVVNPFA